MKALTNLACLLLTLFLLGVGLSPARGANFPGPIQYKQTMIQVADASKSPFKDWGGTESRYFREIVVSADGTKLGFVVKLNLYSDKHIYVMNADGSMPVDLTPNLPIVPVVVDNSDIANLQINDSGSRLFFRAYSLGNIYYFNTASRASSTAFLGANWVESREPYTLNSDGSRLYFQHRWFSEVWHEGLCYADVGTNIAVPVFDVASLAPPDNNYGFRYLGAGRSGSPLLFTYYRNWYTDPQPAMYKATSGTATRTPDEKHTWVWGEQDLPDNIVSADGGRVLYTCQDSGGSEQLYYVNTASGAKTMIAPNCGGVTFPALSPSGAFARFNAAGYYHTRVKLATGDKRDTGSYWFGEAGSVGDSNLSDLTADNRYYFLGSGPYGLPARIHRIDMAPSGSTAPAPDITAISFSKPSLVFDDDNHPVTITAQVNANSGTLQWVKMHTLVEGREFWDGQVYEPLNYGNPLTDAGGGKFTTTATSNKWFYQVNPQPPLPRPIGVRIVAKNTDANGMDHYVMADTVINVTTQGAMSVPATNSLLLAD